MSLVTSVNTQPRSLASLPIPAGLVAGAPPLWDRTAAYAAGDRVSFQYPDSAVPSHVCTALVNIPAPSGGGINPVPYTLSFTDVPVPNASWSVQNSGEPLYDAATTYFPGDVVSYTASQREPQLFLCLSETRGVAPDPSLTNYSWKILAAPLTYTAGVGIDVSGAVISTNLAAGLNIELTPLGTTLRVATRIPPAQTGFIDVTPGTYALLPFPEQTADNLIMVTPASTTLDVVSGVAFAWWLVYNLGAGGWIINTLGTGAPAPGFTAIRFQWTLLQ